MPTLQKNSAAPDSKARSMTRRAQTQSALAVAQSATEFEEPLRSRALDLALDMGAPIDSCAALYASDGHEALLRACLDQGARPLATTALGGAASSESEYSLQGELTLLARAIASNSLPCARLLFERGADLLADLAVPKTLGLYANDSISRWALLREGVDRSAPNTASAQNLALILSVPAARAFGHAAPEAVLALDVLESLTAKGAQISACSSIGESFFERALSMFRFGVNIEFDALSDPLLALTRFSLRHGAEGASANLRSALASFCKTPGGLGSSLPEPPGAESLRQACLMLASSCPPSSPAAASILQASIQGVEPLSLITETKGARVRLDQRPSLANTSANRASRKLWAWLAETSPQWSAPDESALESCLDLMAQALSSSALLFRHDSIAFSRSSPDPSCSQDWLAWALQDFPETRPATLGSGFPLAAAKIAARYHPSLALAFDSAARAASALACSSSDEASLALYEGVLIAARVRPPAEAPRIPVLRI